MGGVGHQPDCGEWAMDGWHAGAGGVPNCERVQSGRVPHHGSPEGGRAVRARSTQRQLHRDVDSHQRDSDDHLHDAGAEGERLPDHQQRVERGPERGPVHSRHLLARPLRRQPLVRVGYRPLQRTSVQQHPAPQPEAQKCKLAPLNHAILKPSEDNLPF
jgi:hypothetical protein